MSEKLFVATRKGLFTVARGTAARGGGRWRVAAAALLGDNVSAVLPDARDGTLWAALEHGHFGAKLHRSRDGGTSWRECSPPAYPPEPDTAVPPARLQRIWCLEAGGTGEPGTLWCGTIPGGLFVTLDGGESWDLVRSLWDDPRRREWLGAGGLPPGIHSVSVDPTDSRHVTVGVSAGGVWATFDGGATWDCRTEGMWAAYLPPERARDPHLQHVHRLVQCRAEPRTLWCQHHNGIFVTRDAGATWTEVGRAGPSASGFTAAVHPLDPGTAWFVPTVRDEMRIPVGGSVVVARTRDGGRSFETLRDGLPREHGYDVAWRHGLDVDARGERLALGSTTGSLWISEDQGDRWVEVSAHLPPVHAVRFDR